MNWTDRLETLVGQLSIPRLEIPPPIRNAKNGIFAIGIFLCLGMIFMTLFTYVHECECLFLHSQTHILQGEYWHFGSH